MNITTDTWEQRMGMMRRKEIKNEKANETVTEDVRHKVPGNRWQRERQQRTRQRRGWSCCGTGASPFSSPLRLSTYPLSHQAAGPLQHLSPAAFLRPVNHSRFTGDRLMCLHKLWPLTCQASGTEIHEREAAWRWMKGREG